jgi:hypothetical protein
MSNPQCIAAVSARTLPGQEAVHLEARRQVPGDGMKILITNDDGICSPGIAALARAASRFGTVRIVAPDVEPTGGQWSGAPPRSPRGLDLTNHEELAAAQNRPPRHARQHAADRLWRAQSASVPH